MRQTRCGLTLTELLTVCSVITILATMVSPVLVRGRQEALRSGCTSNMSQIYGALQLYANANSGKLPRCFDPQPPGRDGVDYFVIENAWWYSKLWRIGNPAAGELDAGAFSPHQCFLRCPGSRDPADQSHSQGTYLARVSGTDKDRVFDDNYGYNNFGYKHPTDQTQSFGFIYANATPSPAVDPETTFPPYYPISKYYRTSNRAGNGLGYDVPTGRPVKGQFRTATKVTTLPSGDKVFGTYIGATADIVQAAATILLADYCKADANAFPGVDEGTVVLSGVTYPAYGYSFRHGGKANVLFVDGHVRTHAPGGARGTSSQNTLGEGLLRLVGTSQLHWEAYR